MVIHTIFDTFIHEKGVFGHNLNLATLIYIIYIYIYIIYNYIYIIWSRWVTPLVYIVLSLLYMYSEAGHHLHKISDVSFDEHLDSQFVQNNNNNELLGDNKCIVK